MADDVIAQSDGVAQPFVQRPDMIVVERHDVAASGLHPEQYNPLQLLLNQVRGWLCESTWALTAIDYEKLTFSRFLNPSFGWQEIETAPQDGTEILVWSGDQRIIVSWQISRAPYPFEGWTTGWETSGGYDVGYSPISAPTYWMPLPAPPCEVGE